MSGLSSEILSVLDTALPDFELLIEKAERLEGGNLNHVWRLPGKKRSIIVKKAPPHIASKPEVPLSPKRILFEARALQLFRKGGPLYKIGSEEIRPPHFLFFDRKSHLLGMEDLGNLFTISRALQKDAVDPGIGKQLGGFIGRLHLETLNKDRYKQRFHNLEIQKSRLEIQYRFAAKYAQKGGVNRYLDIIESQTENLGQKLLKPGKCLVMGDLWPRSVMTNKNRIRLIDWEFSHYGRPLQDIGHFAAHCWMQAQTASVNEVRQKFKKVWLNFWEAYQNTVSEKYPKLLPLQEMKDTATHIGAEILIRATGPFKPGYIYQSNEVSDPLIREASQKAAQLIISDDLSPLWDN